MSIGKVSEFDMKIGAWSSYADRLEMYFKVNGVEEDLKVPIMISVMGDEAYELLINLASPKKPAELTYVEAAELLRHHLQPSPSVLAERYRFRQRRQLPEENVNIYVAELKKLARNCKFGENLNENLRDQFVCGLRSDVTRQRLFAKDEHLLFTNAVKIASSLEAAERDAAAVEARSVPEAAGSVGMHALQVGPERAGRARHQRGGGGGGAAGGFAAGGRSGRTVAIRPAQNGYQRSGGVTNCRGCGATSHHYEDCRFRDYVCSRCGARGHLRRVCHSMARPGPAAAAGTRPRNNTSGFHYGASDDYTLEQETEENLVDLHQLCLSDYKPVSLPISIDGTVICMEIDTGTPISCISALTYSRYFKNQIIKPYNLTLRFYDGSTVKPLGFIKPSVKYNGLNKQLELFVIEKGTTSLLGRQWLNELKIPIGCDGPGDSVVPMYYGNSNINFLLDRYKQLFDGSLGRFTGGKATLRVRDGASPVFHRARPLPYAMRDRVDAELDAMLRAGIIEPVDCSDWASPLVPVNKSDGSLRLCVDYKATLNPFLLIDRYPLPKIEDVLVTLNGAQYFSKIDLSQSYNQILLDESKKYTVINTHRGLFRYNRLVFGLSSSPGIFQRLMSNLLQGIPNVAVFIDDIIIAGKTESEHLQALEMVFQKLLSNGLRVKESKCVFLTQEVTYLGYVLSKDGIKADPTKSEAIQKIPRPQNVTELRSFLGLANFFARFVKNFSQKLVPLYNLLRKGFEWKWTHECEQAFICIKRTLVSSEVLAHYDVKKPLIVTCDASSAGIGGVLSQPTGSGAGAAERPVAFVSRTLTAAEKNYSQIHREALAIIFCMKKFHQYIYGRRFTLRTDHKPLVSLFGPNTGIPTMTASRMQRWALIMSAYTYDIEYVRSSDNSADSLSRLPTVNHNKPVSQAIPEQTYLHFAQDALLLNYNDIKKSTANDPVLSRLVSYIRDGWPLQCDITSFQPYFNRKNEIYEELGCIMWGHRVIIPENCRAKVLEIIHEPHMGIVKSKSLARSYVWWPGMDEAVEATCRACATCNVVGDAPPRQAPRPWPWPSRPWTRVHLDFMGPIFGKIYLVSIDAMSKWIEVFSVPSTSACSTIGKLSELWSRWGIPKQIVSDNGPPFTSSEFATFIRSNGIDHVFTAPYHPASNGAAENAVKTLKRVIKKANLDKINVDTALCKFLLYYRNTAHVSTGESPAQLMLGRHLRTRLDVLRPDREERMKQVQERQVNEAGGGDRVIRPGEDVWYRQYLKSDKWLPGKINTSLGPSNFEVTDRDGNRVHRHIDQLKRRSRSSLAAPGPEIHQQEREPKGDFCKGVKWGNLENSSNKSVSEGARTEQSGDNDVPVDSTRLVESPSTDIPLEPREPTQSRTLVQRPIRQCRLNNVPNYKI